LRAEGQKSGEADENVAWFAGLELSEESGADEDEGNDQGNPGAGAPMAQCGKSHSDVDNVENDETESDVKVHGIVVMTLGWWPEAAGVGQQSDARSKPHGGGALDGDPEIGSEGMMARAFAG